MNPILSLLGSLAGGINPGLLLLSALGGGIASGAQANRASTQNKRTAERAKEIRNQLLGVIGRVRNADYSSLDSATSRVYNRNYEAGAANAASRGITGGASQRQQSNNMLAEAVAQLAQFKTQDQLAREQTVADIYGNEAFAVPDPSTINPGRDALMAFLTGAAGNAGSAALTQLGTNVVPQAQNPLAGYGYVPAPAQAQYGYSPQSQVGGGSNLGRQTSLLPNLGKSLADSGMNFNFMQYLRPQVNTSNTFNRGGR